MSALIKWTVLAVTAVGPLLWSGCSDKSQPSATATSGPMLIEPNSAVGQVRSGMTVAQVEALFGAPPRRTSNAIEYPRLGLAVMAGPDGVVQYVLCGDVTGINGPFVKAFTGHTKEGIGMYSTRADVLKAYGPPTKDEKMFLDSESLRYDPLGITFTLDGGRVHHIAVRLGQEPGTNATMHIDVAPPAAPK